ncbi:hypothetical protein BURPS305_0014 [Burkholderia pseudomallei 305]|nr:hypothetical protein BURPS305_0014 [Burkholderia pseudomallei 305]
MANGLIGCSQVDAVQDTQHRLPLENNKHKQNYKTLQLYLDSLQYLLTKFCNAVPPHTH